MKKQALLDCIITAKSHQHKLAWARSSVELMIEDVAKPGLQGGLAGGLPGSSQVKPGDNHCPPPTMVVMAQLRMTADNGFNLHQQLEQLQQPQLTW
jgi:hypothetical protein